MNKDNLDGIINKLKRIVGTGLLSLAVSNGYGQSGLPINYWDCNCGAGRGAFRDGLHFLDGSSVRLMMDCNGDGSVETNVNKSRLQETSQNGAYDILVYPEDGPICGYNTNNTARNKGTAQIDGINAMPVLNFLDPGASIVQRLDTYLLNARFDGSLLDWVPGTPEATSYDVIRGNVGNLKQSNGLQGAAVEQLACNYPSLSLSNAMLNENPPIGQAFFYTVRPRTSFEIGNYGLGKDNMPRQNPVTGDCL